MQDFGFLLTFLFYPQLGIFLNTLKRILDVLHCRVEDILNSWASCLPVIGDKKTLFGEQMNGITVLLRTKYKTYLQAIIGNLVNSVRSFKLQFYMSVPCYHKMDNNSNHKVFV